MARSPGMVLILLFCTGCYAPFPADRDPSMPAYAPISLPSPSNTDSRPAPLASIPSDERPLPINLPTALQLAQVNAVDIAAAGARIQAAAAQLDQARALWLPTVSMGGDYFGHAGPIQDVSNAVYNNSHGSLMLGAGAGIGPAAVFTLTDALFAPLAAKQQVRATQADRQAASNDTLVAVSDAYFTVQQARGELASALETIRRTQDLVHRTRQFAPAIVPEFELFRAESELSRLRLAELTAREHWKVASAELVRVLRLDAGAQIDPLEPPELRIDLIDVRRGVGELIPVALQSRPELASQQALVEQTLALIKQERWRPWLPSLVVRGTSTPGGTLAAGAFLPFPNSGVSALRGDIDVQLLWQLNNLGFGNAALVRQREAGNHQAMIELYRIQDRVAAEVAQAHAQALQAMRRVKVAQEGLRSAALCADKNLEALGQTKGAGNQQVTLVRPQEVLAAIQALSQAYIDYYAAIADANRAQFRLYRALGQPAGQLIHEEPMRPAGLEPPIEIGVRG